MLFDLFLAEDFSYQCLIALCCIPRRILRVVLIEDPGYVYEFSLPSTPSPYSPPSLTIKLEMNIGIVKNVVKEDEMYEKARGYNMCAIECHVRH